MAMSRRPDPRQPTSGGAECSGADGRPSGAVQSGEIMHAKNRKTIVFAAGISIVFALAAAGLSQPGRRSVEKLVAAITGASAPQTPAATTTAAPDVEQRARSHHGWSTSVLDSVQRGSITYYDGSGAASRQGTL